jgi:hypothetical protein
VLVGLGLKLSDLRSDAFAQHLGSALGLVQSPLCAPQACLRRQVIAAR